MRGSAYVDGVVRELIADLQSFLGSSLEGAYLHGSLVFGDFDPSVSDIDLLIALSHDVDDQQLAGLRTLHEAFAIRHPDWADRVDASYLSLEALRTCTDRVSPFVVISPGEPLHRTRSSRGWETNWYMVREYGKTLFGQPPRSIIAPIDREEFLAAVRAHMREMPRRTAESKSRSFQAHGVLSACRALYACRHGKQASKLQAARWLAQDRPARAPLVELALRVRGDPRSLGAKATGFAAEAAEFVAAAEAEISR